MGKFEINFFLLSSSNPEKIFARSKKPARESEKKKFPKCLTSKKLK
jgi:hypothetical protein